MDSSSAKVISRQVKYLDVKKNVEIAMLQGTTREIAFFNRNTKHRRQEELISNFIYPEKVEMCLHIQLST